MKYERRIRLRLSRRGRIRQSLVAARVRRDIQAICNLFAIGRP